MRLGGGRGGNRQAEKTPNTPEKQDMTNLPEKQSPGKAEHDEPPGKAAPRISRAPLTPEKAGHAVSEKARQKTGRRVMRHPALVIHTKITDAGDAAGPAPL